MRTWRRWGAGGVVLTLLCLAVIGFSATSALAQGTSARQTDTALPPSVLPVIVLQGSDYDMGYQYFQQVDKLFGPSILEAMQVPSGFTSDQLTALKAYQWYIERDTPEYIDMFKGMAAAATDLGIPLSYAEVLANYVGTTAYPGTEPAGSGGASLPPLCSAWAAWGKTTSDGKLIQAQEMDPPWGDFGDNNYVAIVAYPATGNAYINVTQPGQLTTIPVMPGINDKGVATGGNLGGAWRDADYGTGGGYGLMTGQMMHILRFTDSAAAAKDMWLSFHVSGVWNMTTSDTEGNAFVVESSAAFQNVRKPGQFGEGDFIYSRNCFFTNGEASLNGKPGKFYPHGGWALDPWMSAPPDSQSDMQLASVRTNQTMYDMLHEYAGHVNLAFAEMMFRHHGKIPSDPWNLKAFRRNRAKYYGNPGNLNAGFVTISQPSPGGGTMDICTGAVGRVGLPYEPGWEDDVYQVASTHTFYSLTLAGGPRETANASQSTAERTIALAYQKLMYKKYSDPGYATLAALFSLANTEYLEGSSWLNDAAGDSGSQQLLDYSQAATSFANAQAHAEELREDLVSPATSPSSLGLKPYIPYEYGF